MNTLSTLLGVGSLLGFAIFPSHAEKHIHPVLTCVWSPSGPVVLAPGGQQTFVAQTGCGGQSVSINPANGTAGFTAGTNCTLTSTTTGSAIGTFKVRGCSEGSVVVTIATGQTINVTVDVP